jgi:hypothetical protein
MGSRWPVRAQIVPKHQLHFNFDNEILSVYAHGMSAENPGAISGDLWRLGRREHRPMRATSCTPRWVFRRRRSLVFQRQSRDRGIGTPHDAAGACVVDHFPTVLMRTMRFVLGVARGVCASGDRFARGARERALIGIDSRGRWARVGIDSRGSCACAWINR